MDTLVDLVSEVPPNCSFFISRVSLWIYVEVNKPASKENYDRLIEYLKLKELAYKEFFGGVFLILDSSYLAGLSKSLNKNLREDIKSVRKGIIEEEFELSKDIDERLTRELHYGRVNTDS